MISAHRNATATNAQRLERSAKNRLEYRYLSHGPHSRVAEEVNRVQIRSPIEGLSALNF